MSTEEKLDVINQLEKKVNELLIYSVMLD